MKNMDKLKMPLLILIAVVAVALIGNQMGLFAVVGCGDYCIKSLDSNAETGAIGGSVDFWGNAYTRTTGVYGVEETSPSNQRKIVYVRRVVSGDSSSWRFHRTISNIQEHGTYSYLLYKCTDTTCSSKTNVDGSATQKSFRIDAPSSGGTTIPSDPTIPSKPDDGCSGTTYVTYNLFGTTWVPSYQYNSASCGYSPPTQPPTPEIPQQPADRCDGTTKVTYSWSGSTWVPASQFNSVDCGYVAPNGGTTPPSPVDDKPADATVIVLGSIIVLGGLGAVFMKMKK